MVAATPPVRVDALPEHSVWRDTGCDVSPSCLRCPLPVCKYDDPGYLERQRIAARQERVRKLRSRGMNVVAIAAELGVSARSVHRDLALVRGG